MAGGFGSIGEDTAMRRVRVLSTSLAAVFVLTSMWAASISLAEQRGEDSPAGDPASKWIQARAAKETPKRKNPAAVRAGKPDLIVNEIRASDTCLVRIWVRNVGTAGVPESAYASSGPGAAYFRITNLDTGATISGGLNVLDPERVLQRPDSEVASNWMRVGLSHGSHAMRGEIDTNSKISESDEGNNLMNKSVTCGE